MHTLYENTTYKINTNSILHNVILEASMVTKAPAPQWDHVK